MKVVCNFEETPQNNTILVYNNNEIICVEKDVFLFDLNNQINELKKENAELKEYINNIVSKVDEKLKSYHNILQQAVKEE